MSRNHKYLVWDRIGKRMLKVVELKWRGDYGDDINKGPVEVIAKGDGHESLFEFDLREFTGNKDKNGREIYEGDILNIKTKDQETDPVNGNFEVLFDRGMFRTTFYAALARIAEPDPKSLYECAVVGNIYENPELLS